MIELKRQISYDEILADKTLQQAFYKAPSLWNLFVAELTGKKSTRNWYLTNTTNS
jgi:hypothetical protein